MIEVDTNNTKHGWERSGSSHYSTPVLADLEVLV